MFPRSVLQARLELLLRRLIQLSLKSTLYILSIFNQEIALKQVMVNREKQVMFPNVPVALKHLEVWIHLSHL